MEQRKPNIVYILADDLGYEDVSSLNPGRPFPTTHFDRLSSEGMYIDAHAKSAVCFPSFPAMLNWRSKLNSSALGRVFSPLIDEGRRTVYCTRTRTRTGTGDNCFPRMERPQSQTSQ